MQGLRHSFAVRQLVKSATARARSVETWPLMRLFTSTPGWVSDWLAKIQTISPPPDKYMPTDGPATASGIYERMLVIGAHRNKLSRAALHYLLRACHQPSDLEVIAGSCSHSSLFFCLFDQNNKQP